MGNFLNCPNSEIHSERFESFCKLEVGAACMQGWRTEMEDDHVIVDIPSCPDHLFLGVFDGHGGEGAAKYAAKHIVSVLVETSEFRGYVEGKCEDLELLIAALKTTFMSIDVDIRAHQDKNLRDASGCTAVTAVVTPTHIICANAGDSRCVMGTAGVAKALSEDHKPTDKPEHKRIIDAGGTVQWKRVNGDLAVSRAFGDFQFKDRPDLPAEEQKVTCAPEFVIHTRTAKDDVLLLACDGLWDVMTNTEAIDHVRKVYQMGETNVALIAEEMTDVALRKGSKDNISAVVVKLPGAVLGPASNGGVERLRHDTKQHAHHLPAESHHHLDEDEHEYETHDKALHEEDSPTSNPDHPDTPY